MNIVPYTIDRIPDVLDFETRLRAEEPFFMWDIGEKYQADVKASFSDPRFDGCMAGYNTKCNRGKRKRQ